MSGNRAKHVSNRTVGVAFSCLALSVLAILLWGRIKLVAGVPRTAYAEPKTVATPPPPPTKAIAKPAPANRPDLQGD